MTPHSSGSWRVLHVIATLDVGGGSEHLIHLVRGLGARGHSSTVVFGRPGPALERLREAGAGVHAVGTLRFAGPLQLARAFRFLPHDLVHLHGTRSGFFGALALRGRPDPIVYTGHAFSFNRRLPGLLRAVAVRAERFIVTTARRTVCLTEGDLATARRLGIPTQHFVVVPNGIPIERFEHAADRRAEFGLPAGTPCVGLLARLVEQKDPLAFVAMAARLAARRPDVRFIVAGDGPLRAAAEQAARAAGLGAAITFCGFRTDAAELLKTFDVAVFPSLWEGLPLAVLEAMAAGAAVVASDLPGHREILEDGVHGRITPPGDPAALAAAVEELLQDPARRARLVAAARERVRERFTVERMVERTVAVYRDAIARADAPGLRATT